MPEQGGEQVTTEVDVKTAVKAAMDYFAELYGSPFADLALEEVEKVLKGGYKWLVTLGFYPARRNLSGSLTVVPSVPRQFKVLTVNAETGEVESMKATRL